jgi:hypothetical protein
VSDMSALQPTPTAYIGVYCTTQSSIAGREGGIQYFAIVKMLTKTFSLIAGEGDVEESGSWIWSFSPMSSINTVLRRGDKILPGRW